jgi:hypothetical protein
LTQSSRIQPVKAAGGLSQLVIDLRSTDTVRREAAIARLRVAGPAAIPHLRTLITSDPDMAARAAALTVLEGIDDERVDAVGRAALATPDSGVVIAALRLLRGRVAREQGVRTLDALTAVALDESRETSVRRAALDALSELPAELVAPVVAAVRGQGGQGQEGEGGEGLQAGDPRAVGEWLGRHGATASLSSIHDLMTRLRERERTEPDAGRRQEWLTARGATHAVLAGRGSRVALYDLREAFDEATGALPLDFLAAVTAIGDASCLEPMARAWAAAPHETWWRDRLAGAARDIMRRTRLTARHAVVKRVRSKWPGVL